MAPLFAEEELFPRGQGGEDGGVPGNDELRQGCGFTRFIVAVPRADRVVAAIFPVLQEQHPLVTEVVDDEVGSVGEDGGKLQARTQFSVQAVQLLVFPQLGVELLLVLVEPPLGLHQPFHLPGEHLLLQA